MSYTNDNTGPLQLPPHTSNNPPLPDPASYETTVLGTGESAQVSPHKKVKPRRAHRERLLERDDWKIVLLIVGLAFAASVIGATASVYIVLSMYNII